MKSVTILMAVCDPPLPMLELAVDSILEQTFHDFEFLILDDGSRRKEILAYLSRRASEDPRIRTECEPHRGLTRTLNLGLARVASPFIARQDADDWSEPRRLEHQVAFLQSHPETALCGCEAWTHQQNGNRLWRLRLPHTHPELMSAFWNGNPFVHGSVMFRREAALAVGGYREEFSCSQDYDFFWRLSAAAEVANLPEPLYHYRFSGGSVSAEHAAEQARVHRAARSLAAVRRRGETENIEAAMGIAAEEDHQLQALLKQADHLMLAGQYGRAFAEYTRLILSHPWSPLAWGKLLRCGIFVGLPLLREVCFR